MTTLDPFAPGESVGYFKFDQVGDTAAGLVDKVTEVPETEFGTGTPLTWPDGRPKMIYCIELRNVDTGEVLNLWARKQMISAIRGAAKEAGGIVGKVLKVKYDHDGTPSKAGYRPPKVYKAKVEPAPAKVAPRIEPKPVEADPFGDEEPFLMDDRTEDTKYIRRATIAIVVGVTISLVVLTCAVFTWKLVTPRLNLYRSNTEKQAVIAEQQAISEAAIFAAEKRVTVAKADAAARLIEAESIADSQEIIAATLTDEYLRWRYYEVLQNTANAVVYVATESGLPITESSRLTAPPVTTVP